MSKTEVTGSQIKDATVTRDDLNITTTGKAVVRRLIAGSNVSFTETGVDSGTGDVTINATAAAGVSSVGTIDSQTKSANGLVIVSSSIYAQNADASFPGLVSTGTQTIAGAKTWSGLGTFSSGISSAGTLIFTGSNGDITSNTSDGSDNKRVRIGGGGDVIATRGAFIEVCGNEHTNTGKLYLNAGNVSGGQIIINTSGSDRFAFDESGGIIYKATLGYIIPDTSDGSDSKRFFVAGGGAASSTRGAFLEVDGNEGANPGKAELQCGNVSGATVLLRSVGTQPIEFYTNNISRWSISSGGDLVGATSPNVLRADTVDGTDNKKLFLAGGGGTDSTRGSFLELGGNESADNGRAMLVCGNQTGAEVLLRTFGSQAITMMTNNTTRWAINSGGSLIFSGSPQVIAADTADASDSKVLFIAGGGSNAATRGGFLTLGGNEASTYEGYVELTAGSVSNANARIVLSAPSSSGQLQIYTNGTHRWSVLSSGHLEPGAGGTYDIGNTSSPNHVRKLTVLTIASANNDMTIGPVTGHAIFFTTNGSNRWSIGGAGIMQPETDGTLDLGTSSKRVHTVYSTEYAGINGTTNGNAYYAQATNASYAANIHLVDANRSGNSAFNFIQCRSNVSGSPDQEFTFRGDGNGLCDGSFTGGGADYAEYFETVDGEPISPGKSVVLDGSTAKVRLFDDQVDELEDILGVTRPKWGGSATIGNLPLNWHKKYLRDSFGSYILDENGERQINPEFDPEEEYVSRDSREEWVVVGLLGQVPIIASQAKNPNWKKMKDIDETCELYFIK